MRDRFEELLKGLSDVFDLSLHVDKHHACSIRVHEHLTVQLQLDISQEHLFLFAKVAEIPPGKFRENVLKECLKANALPDPRIAILAYRADGNLLVIFQRYPLDALNGNNLAGLLGAFLEFGDSWHKAIRSGQAAPPRVPGSGGPSSQPNPFGLKP